MRLPKPLKVLGVATLVAGLAVGAVAVTAGATSSDPTYYACLSGGKLSRVGTAAPTCTAPATGISWNQSGPKGPAGKTILSGTGAPATTIGAVGDFYLETSNHKLYGPAGHECIPLPCHTLWGSGISLVGPAGPPGQGQVFETQATGPIAGDGGASIRVLTQTLPDAGDYYVNAHVDGVWDFATSAHTRWNCDLVAANPGGSTVVLDSVAADGSNLQTELYLQGTVSLAAGGLVGINCDETAQSDGQAYMNVRIDSTQVSGFTPIAPS